MNSDSSTEIEDRTPPRYQRFRQERNCLPMTIKPNPLLTAILRHCYSPSPSDMYDIQSLLTKGYWANIMDRSGAAPLHYVAWKGSCEIARLLLDNGALPDMRNIDGWTPFMLCAHER